MATKVTTTGQTTFTAKVRTTGQTTFVKKIVIGTPVRSVTQQSLQFTSLSDTEITNALDNQIIVFDSSLQKFVNTDSASLINLTLSGNVKSNLVPSQDSSFDLGDSAKKWRDLYLSGGTIHLGGLDISDSATQFSVTDSTGTPVNFNLSGSTSQIRGMFSAGGDLSYNSSSGEFSFDVEQVYTKANFDSDFNIALDSAALEGVGLTFDNTTNTLAIDSAELEAFFKPDIRGYFTASNTLNYDSTTGDFSLPQALNTTASPTFRNITTLQSGHKVEIISNTGTIQSTNNPLRLKTTSNGQPLQIYHNDALKLQTLITGVNINGTVNADSGTFTNINVPDNGIIKLGNDSDLKIFHNESHSIIQDAGTGSLLLQSNNFTVQNATGTENQITALSGGAVSLYHNDSAKLATTSAGVDVTGTINADSATLTNVTADSGVITDISGSSINYDSAKFTTLTRAATVDSATYGSASQVPVLTVNTSGFIDSIGTISVAGVSSVAFDSASFNYTINTADGGTFTKMIHTRKPGLAAGTHGSASKVPIVTINQYGLVDSIGTTNVAGVTSTSFDSSTGIFTINTADGNSFTTHIQDSADLVRISRTSLSATDAGGDGSFSYDNGTGVFTYTGPSATETRAHMVAGTGVTYDSASGVISIGQPVGTTDNVTFADATFTNDVAFDSAGALFFDKSSKFLIFSKGHGAVFGTTSGALIKHDGTGMSYANITGQTKISNLGPGNQILLQARDGENSIVLGDDSALKLYFYNSKKLETTVYGTTVTGTLNADSGTFTNITADSAVITDLSGNTLNYISVNTPLITGPTTLTIDPAAIGDNTGTVRILGNLTVEGTQTTINSTSVTINDKTIRIADSAADSSELNQAGIVFGGSLIPANRPSFKYNHTQNRFAFNRNILADGFQGDGSALTNLTATNLTGTIDSARIPGLAAADIVTGTIDSARLPVISIANDAHLLDGLNSTQFLRSDEDDTMTGNLTVAGQITVDSATVTGMLKARNAVISLNDDDSGVFSTLTVGERTFNDGIASIALNNQQNTLSAKLDGAGSYVGFWTGKNTTNGYRFLANFGDSDETVQLRPLATTRLEANKYGATVTGTINADSATVLGTLNFDSTGDTTRLRLSQINTFGGDILNVQNDKGYVYVGPANNAYSHFLTDRTRFYFNKKLIVDEGIVSSYNENLQLQNQEVTKLTLNDYGATVTGTINADSATLTNINLPDNGKIIFGDSGDLKIYHEGSNSIIEDAGTGMLDVKASYFRVTNANGSKIAAQFSDFTGPSGGAQLFFDGTKRFETKDSGVNVIGQLTADSATLTNINLPDNGKIILGDSGTNDFFIQYSGTQSQIDGSHVRILTNDFRVKNPANNETYIKAVQNGAVELYYDNVKKLETTDSGVQVIGSLRADSATTPRITLLESDYTDAYGATDGNFVVADMGGGRVDFGFSSTTFGPAVELYNKHSTQASGVKKGRVGITYGGEDGLGDVTFTHRRSANWVERANLDAFGNFQMDGQLSADSATLSGPLTVTGGNDGDLLINFATDRSWQFQQAGDNAATRLQLKANVDSKFFDVVNQGGERNFEFFTSSADPFLRIRASDSDATAGPTLKLHRSRTVPAVDDEIGEILFEGRNDAAEDVQYARIYSEIKDKADGTESGAIKFEAMRNGTLASFMTMNGEANQIYLNKKLNLQGNNILSTGDVQFDSAGAVFFDKSDQSLIFGDNYRAKFGTGGDGSIRFNGSNLVIDTNTGGISLQPDTEVNVWNGSQYVFRASKNNNNVELWASNSKKLETTDSGVAVTGQITADSATITGFTRTGGLFSNGNIANFQSTKGVYAGLSTAGDAQLSLVGDNTDVSPQIDFSHDVSIDYDVRLILENSGYRLSMKSHGNETMANFNGDGAVELYHDNVKKFETTAYGATVTGTVNADSATFAGGDIRISTAFSSPNIYIGGNAAQGTDGLNLTWTTGNGGFIQNNTNDLHLRNYANDKDISLETDNGSGATTQYVLAKGSTGAVELNHYGNKKLETTAYGTTVTGTINADSATFGPLTADSSVIGGINLNTIGVQSTIQKNGALNIKGNWIRFQKPNSTTDMIIAKPDGEVELYYNGSQKLETKDSGVDVTGLLSAGVLEGKGGVTYDPVGGSGTDTSANVGLALFSGKRIVLSENGYIRTIADATWGSALQFGQSGTGAFAGTEVYGGNSGVKLKYSATTRLETTDSGVAVTGQLTADSATISGPLKVNVDSDASAEIGRAHVGFMGWTDLAGFSHIDQNGTTTYSLLQANNGKTYLNSAAGQSTSLRVSNNTVASVAAGGVTVTGTMNADSATISGDITASKLRLTAGGDASLSSTGHAFQSGSTSSLNVIIDGNEILARNNGSASQLNLNTNGGQVRIGDQNEGTELSVRGPLNLTSDSSQLSTLTPTTISSFSSSTYTGGKLIITAHDHVSGARQISELLVIRDSSAGTAVATEYGQIYTSGSLATYDVDINSGNVRVLATSATTNATTYQVAETLMRE